MLYHSIFCLIIYLFGSSCAISRFLIALSGFILREQPSGCTLCNTFLHSWTEGGSWFPLMFLCVDHVCGFEDMRICGFTQDRGDVFDWTRQNHLSQNPKRSVNTGPDTDRSGTKEGKNTNLFLPTIRIWRETLFYSVQMYFIALFQTPNMTVWPILRKLILFYFILFYFYVCIIIIYFCESFCPLKNLVVTRFILSVYNKGYYMYIETSRPRQAGDRARLLSPLYNVTAARGPTGTTRTPYCVSFYYHMNGKHIGEPGLNSHSS